MDNIGIFSNLSVIAIFLPLFFAVYLFCARLSLTFVNKKILNWGCCFFNLVSFILFCLADFFALDRSQITKLDFNFFTIDKFSLNFGIFVDDTNIAYLLFTSFLCLILSLYSKFYFDKKKQFIFTKQRYYIFMSAISFLTYFFIASENLFQGVIALFLQSVLILSFAYFDIFKNPTNHNITRFHRIALIGNFALLFAALILFKYAILSQGYIESNSLNYNELNVLVSYTYGICSALEFKVMALCVVLAFMSRLVVFPFSCYYSFFANSSDILYLVICLLTNNIVGIFLFLKFLPILELGSGYVLFFEIFIAIGILLSLISILFERNVKIIFGYLLSAINSIFIILFLLLDSDVLLIQKIYFALNILFAALLMYLFFKDKINFPRRFINKQVGFVLEKTHIIIFETIPDKISRILNVIDEKLIQNISPFLVKLFNYFISLIVLKITKTNGINNVKNILITFAIFALIAIFIALFGGVK